MNLRTKRILKTAAGIVLVMLGILSGVSCAIRERLGEMPKGEDLERIKRSPNWRNGEFQNQEETIRLSRNFSFFRALRRHLFASKGNTVPPSPIPAIKSDLKALPPDRDALVWFGHSSLFLQLGGRRILIDPVFSSYAAPLPFVNRAFPAEYSYTADDMPDLDLLVISHDHYDHLDMPTVKALANRAAKVLCPLGVGSHLRYWGVPAGKITEADWGETIEPMPECRIHVLTSRHFSGRGTKANQTLWAGFLFETAAARIYYSGDGGYGKHFAQIGIDHPGIDLAIMEAGQYNDDWPLIHMMPEQSVAAARDVGAKRMMGVHYGRFALARHAWDEPARRLKEATETAGLPLVVPVIGEVLFLK